MNKVDNKGFGVIGIILVLLIVGLSGFIGYTLWQQNKDDAGKYECGQGGSLEFCSAGDATGTKLETPPQASKDDIVKAPADNIKFSDLPAKLQTVVLTESAKYSPPCAKDGHMVDANGQQIDPLVAFAIVGNYQELASAIVTCGKGGSYALYATDKEGNWQFVAYSTDGNFACDSIFDNPVSKALITTAFNVDEAECVDGEGGATTTFDAAYAKRYY